MRKYIFLLVIVVSIATGDDFSPELIINTTSLGLVQGEINPLLKNVRQFIGIHFAQPPIGALRFKPPVPLTPMLNASSSMIYNATAAAHLDGLNCLQMSLIEPWIISGQEDCLYLDIFHP
jgi:carboxylesterase type B